MFLRWTPECEGLCNNSHERADQVEQLPNLRSLWVADKQNTLNNKEDFLNQTSALIHSLPVTILLPLWGKYSSCLVLMALIYPSADWTRNIYQNLVSFLKMWGTCARERGGTRGSWSTSSSHMSSWTVLSAGQYFPWASRDGKTNRLRPSEGMCLTSVSLQNYPGKLGSK